jgi:uncharacterized protein
MLSKYTYLFDYEDRYFLFNSQTCTFLKIEQALYALLNGKIEPTDMNDSLLDFLCEKKIIVPEEEYHAFYQKKKIEFYARAYANNNLSLVIVPNTGCNFDCPYCFETHKVMKEISERVISDLVTFVKGCKDVTQTSLTWYGGEPLLSAKRIEEILEQLSQIETWNLTRHSLITNGYLLNEKVFDLFKKYPLTSIQITLDGREEIHNQKRKLKSNGEPTYRKIVENIDRAFEEWPDTKINIRININKENKDDFLNEQQKFLSRWPEKKLYIYPGLIREDNDEGTKLSCRSFVAKEMEQFNLEMKEKGAKINLFPQNAHQGCMVNSIKAYIVGPEGEIYKCWNDVGNPSKIVGYIQEDKITNLSLFSRYLDASSFNDEKCAQCFFFPICSGGCAWYRLKNKYENGQYDICSIHKRSKQFKKTLLTHYYYKRGNHNEMKTLKTPTT